MALLLLAAAGTPGSGQSVLPEGLSVHGFLTQAYGVSDGHQRLGIPSYGTADYRVAALLFRYDATDQDAFVLQFSHERIGRSPLTAGEPAVDLDWVFYERRFGENTLARVGKIRTPVGIYNEIRDVGTLLPLYRPPTTLYGEQMYASETVDGAMVGHRVPLGDWSLDLEGFFGSWEYLQWDLETIAEIDGGAGAQVWLRTPLQGLRVGGSALRYTARNVQDTPEGFEDSQVLWMASVDGTFPRFFIRGEGYELDFGSEAGGYEVGARGYYGQLGFNVTDAVGLVAQAEWTDLELEVFEPMPFLFDDNMERDLSLGVRYSPLPNLVLKLEGHRYSGYGIENETRIIGLMERADVTYGLLSVSTSF